MPILILPPRQTPDAEAIRSAAVEAGWRVEQLASWRAPEWLRGHDLILYGEPLFADVVTPTLGLALLEAPPDWLVTLPPAYRRRDVRFMTLGDAKEHRDPAFVKPAHYGCDARQILPVLARAAVKRHAIRPEDQVWIREQYVVEIG
jgi:hypothetical protein